jgi:hypothetical protein
MDIDDGLAEQSAVTTETVQRDAQHEDACDVVEREGAWMPDKPATAVPNAPEAGWLSSSSKSGESTDEESDE